MAAESTPALRGTRPYDSADIGAFRADDSPSPLVLLRAGADRQPPNRERRRRDPLTSFEQAATGRERQPYSRSRNRDSPSRAIVAAENTGRCSCLNGDYVGPVRTTSCTSCSAWCGPHLARREVASAQGRDSI